MLPLTLPEMRRLLCRRIWTARPSERETLAWSHWRRRHQARVSRCHYQRHLQRLAARVRLYG
ncbi:MAG: hypothetical protein K6U89_03875 [Chloroflexi bacterium]|nr:hypothetical protein [Chloroflexota bacterium]